MRCPACVRSDAACAFRICPCGKNIRDNLWKNGSVSLPFSNADCGKTVEGWAKSTHCGERNATFTQDKNVGKYGKTANDSYFSTEVFNRCGKPFCFHKLFHTLWKSTAGVRKMVENLYESVWRNKIFPHRAQSMFCQQPLISLIISSISLLKIGSDNNRFSTISIEAITVEWSRLKIFPTLGRDISVMVRMRYTAM